MRTLVIVVVVALVAGCSARVEGGGSRPADECTCPDGYTVCELAPQGYRSAEPDCWCAPPGRSCGENGTPAQ
jgi:hypothetical protein